MVFLIGLLGLGIGNLLNLLIARQLPGFRRGGRLRRAPGSVGWVPLLGKCSHPRVVGLAVEVLCAVMAVALFLRYGLSLRSLVFFGASLVLINTAAIDFKIRMIDTLVLVVAIVLVVLLAPLSGIGGDSSFASWLSSVLGLVLASIVFLLLYGLSKMLFPGVAVPFGLGDVYLGAFIGALVGFLAVPTALFYGIAMGGLVSAAIIVLRAMGRKMPAYIAYGTYLCLGTLLFLVTGRF